ncbi:unnamed protein product [Schistocephalus solidus]|uniref:Thioredoxin domain-containing protein n=1 Tax=Schistocephalus solidus TaxID=70667 RepID=A0A183SUY4_SCHSO|nr:unnamed protein product [Schistocephalus solidus]
MQVSGSARNYLMVADNRRSSVPLGRLARRAEPQLITALLRKSAYVAVSRSTMSISKVHTGLWLLKFYAPWCSFCRQLEPVYQEVALTLSRILPEVHVARIDVPANPAVSADFGIRGYPTIIFSGNFEPRRLELRLGVAVDGREAYVYMRYEHDGPYTRCLHNGHRYPYQGERAADDLVKFVIRTSGPAVKKLGSQEELGKELQVHKDEALFVFSGSTKSALWEAYNKVADELRLQVSFVALEKDVSPEPVSASLRVFKDGIHFSFKPQADADDLREEVRRWVLLERHPAFQRISALGIRRLVAEINLVSSAQSLSLVVFVLSPDETDVASHRFVWCSDVDSVSRLVMTSLQPPNLFVYGPEDIFALHPLYNSIKELRELTAVEVRNFLKAVASGEVRDLVYNSPVLALLVFGFPLGCLSCLCYCICWGSFEDDPEAVEFRARSRRFELPYQLLPEEQGQKAAEMTKESNESRSQPLNPERLLADAHLCRRSPTNTTFLGNTIFRC